MKKIKFLKNLKFDSSGLIPCVVQDAKDRTVLMVAYMNQDSLQRTLQEKKACYWSRSRQKFWLKGEESGNFQIVKELAIDCDGDCILIFVEQIGGAACHTGMRSCFYRKVSAKGNLTIHGKKIFDPKKVYKK
ncbi:MAG: phosphoribosyl-AMP cyclohydrolase [Elusimicrobia bacterium RIFCSPLOWO2_02_FULL_39_32]|nr:MAG: phosphoribosyl-AMP cyclohydrolase [Elusimicrobia bacterium GWA2_38_7]OGR79290.1 MAG: phosphoribosyl-AMP cyclohydrolase [Elusimicrobia bacterium RIFCSPHIGHO2_02_FULL_39_36]OGR93191.1 MAG: phosphoribosyl-AMP cyclohydrolase [Elusimicrobia bacterium RIFCSPLOWO2_02_FULL_39_32]OGR99416.1 MAG: phosphoribosyl-AMP cyclohydrolase [Elusimicrobia bacterium RIFCSPLOWO2_12_FULL_39_28]